MLTILTLLLAAAAPAAQTSSTAEATTAAPTDWQCSTGRNRLRNQESRETWDQIKAMKKDGSAGVPPEAQALLNQMTEMFEKDDSRYSSDTAEMMREFAGGKAERRTAC
jgi:Spy/CpxP family protein refolding chaperone